MSEEVPNMKYIQQRSKTLDEVRQDFYEGFKEAVITTLLVNLFSGPDGDIIKENLIKTWRESMIAQHEGGMAIMRAAIEKEGLEIIDEEGNRTCNQNGLAIATLEEQDRTIRSLIQEVEDDIRGIYYIPSRG